LLSLEDLSTSMFCVVGRIALILGLAVFKSLESKFGVRGDGRLPVKVGAIVLDDAHVALISVREAALSNCAPNGWDISR
jgi:hypothetical protein